MALCDLFNNSGFRHYATGTPCFDAHDALRDPITPCEASVASGSSCFDDNCTMSSKDLFGASSSSSSSADSTDEPSLPLPRSWFARLSPQVPSCGIADTPGGPSGGGDFSSKEDLAYFNERHRARLLSAGFSDDELCYDDGGLLLGPIPFDCGSNDGAGGAGGAPAPQPDCPVVVDEQDSISAAPGAYDAAFADEIDAFFAAAGEAPFNAWRQAPEEPFSFAAAAGPSGLGSVVGGGSLSLFMGAPLDLEVFPAPTAGGACAAVADEQVAISAAPGASAGSGAEGWPAFDFTFARFGAEGCCCWIGGDVFAAASSGSGSDSGGGDDSGSGSNEGGSGSGGGNSSGGIGGGSIGGGGNSSVGGGIGGVGAGLSAGRPPIGGAAVAAAGRPKTRAPRAPRAAPEPVAARTRRQLRARAEAAQPVSARTRSKGGGAGASAAA
ncbi:hypothetical protein MNEG_8895 [Monoraphidium neglectum]|uniref:Uncharacterized protein n=1 Tax=Monoraphidium neglectum TaxID=145388 RepID=A0A0D2JI92_9CHLO|nr:hypothetical protein MNEG_8895 [Monoraphidium neglectum]KIY99067.1 hypothetical protein MNEG_8895 [Monoraphidium neglectum]|eukprot:XP_013898087.1 hypothetical protein MNEG_8895 [Monoraphidium neglectum]